MAEGLPGLPANFAFHCPICGTTRPGSGEELLRDVEDDSLWPHCCGARMTVVFLGADDAAGAARGTGTD